MRRQLHCDRNEVTDLTDELVALCRIFAAFEKEQVCCGDVTVAQCVVLQSLLEQPSEAAVLAERNGVSRPAMTRLVDGLERREWVVRTRDPEDRRHVTIELTDAGRREAQMLYDRTKQAVETVLGRVPRGKRNQVIESIKLLREILDECRASC